MKETLVGWRNKNETVVNISTLLSSAIVQLQSICCFSLLLFSFLRYCYLFSPSIWKKGIRTVSTHIICWNPGDVVSRPRMAHLPTPRVQTPGDGWKSLHCKSAIFDHVWIPSKNQPKPLWMFVTAILALTDVDSMQKLCQLSTMYCAIWLVDFWPITILVKYISTWLPCSMFSNQEQLKYDN